MVMVSPASINSAEAEAMTTWIATFGVMNWMISVQATHFKNELMQTVAEELMIEHHFTTAYSPRANGSVERVCCKVLRACVAVLHKFRLSPKDWPAVTKCVQRILNQAALKPLELRGKDPGVYRTPLEVFTGHRPFRPLLEALPMDRYKSIPTITEVRARPLVDIEWTQEALDSMHRDVEINVSARRQRANVRAVSFSIGDFVLIGKAHNKWHKLQWWRGPRQIVECKSVWVFEVRDLVKGKREIVHARRINFYRSALENQEMDPNLLSYPSTVKRHIRVLRV